jgi:hypothetical protein
MRRDGAEHDNRYFEIKDRLENLPTRLLLPKHADDLLFL